jgi:3-hydroxyacyl-CoA dehydrogenase
MKVGVVGAGAMGSGITYVASVCGFDVALLDMEQRFLDAGMKKIKANFMTGVDKGKLSPKQAQDAFSRIKPTLDFGALCDGADVVVEAVFEEMEVKKKIFSTLDKTASPGTILASNTSTLPITEIAAATSRADKVCGMHFFNPVPAMKLVEIVSGKKTSGETLETVRGIAEKLGKEVVMCKDGPGFIFNRILLPTAEEIIKIHEEGLASMDRIDGLAVRGIFPMGPFALMDFIGLDVVLNAAETLHRAFGEKYAPPELLKKTVGAGCLGNKTGKGIKDFDTKIAPQKNDEYIFDRILFVLINEACKVCREEGIATIPDIDKAMRLGGNFTKGPFQLADEVGSKKIEEGLRRLQEEKKSDFYAPSALLVEKTKEGKRFY